MSRPLDALAIARALAAGETLWLLTDSTGRGNPELFAGSFEEVQDALLAECGIEEWPLSWRLTPVARVTEERERCEVLSLQVRTLLSIEAELDRQLARLTAHVQRVAS